MGIRKFILLLLAATFIGLILFLYIGSRHTILNSFLTLEDHLAQKNGERVLSALKSDLHRIHTLNLDWSSWDDAYRFITDKNPAFIQSNLNAETIINQGLNAILFFDPSGRLVWGQFVDLDTGKEAHIPRELSEVLPSTNSLLRSQDPEVHGYGLYQLPQGPSLITIRPILTSKDTGPVRGHLVMVRIIDQPLISDIAARTKLNVSFVPIKTNFRGQQARPLIEHPKEIFTQSIVDENTLISQTALYDIQDKPILALKVTMPRDVFAQGTKTLHHNLISLVLASFVFCIVILILVEKRILIRLSDLAGQISAIGKQKLFSNRITLSGKDELALLAGNLNGMLEQLEESKAELSQNERYIRQVLDSISAGVILVNPENQTIVETNAYTLAILGVPRTEVIGQANRRFICPADVTTSPATELDQKTNILVETLLKPDGTEIPILKSESRIDRSGKEYLLETFIDISELNQAQRAQRLSEEAYKTIFMHSGTAMIRIEDDSIISLANAEFEKMSGFKRHEIENLKSWNEFFHPDDLAFMDLYQKRLMVSPMEPPRHFECRFIGHSGKQKNVYMTIAPIEGSDWRIAALIDISPLKQAEEEKRSLEKKLLHAQKMQSLGTLTGGIAHDFNNLLQILGGNIQILRAKKAKDDPEHAALIEVEEAIIRGSDLVRRLLTFSRRMTPQPHRVQLNTIIEDTLIMVSRTIPKMITIETKLSADLHEITADPTQMEQILINLIGNAVDAIDGQGAIIIETRNASSEEALAKKYNLPFGDYVHLKFSDTGQGIDPAIVQLIFEPFFTTKQIGKGTGLGLSTVYGITTAHSGQIFCESIPNLGTSFHIFLPKPQNELIDEPTVAQVDGEVRGGHETILLVDDEPMILQSTSEMLTYQGYNVLVAQSGEEALSTLVRKTADLIILDLGMPGMGGEKALQLILDRSPSAKVLIASGYLDHKMARDAKKFGARAFLPKPYSLSVMLKLIRDTLDKA